MACWCAAGASARAVEDRGMLRLRGARVRGRRRRAGLVVVRLVAGLRGMVQRSLLPAARSDRYQWQREREAQHPAAADVSGSRRRRGSAHDQSMKVRVEAVSRCGSGVVPVSRSAVPISSMHMHRRRGSGPSHGTATRHEPGRHVKSRCSSTAAPAIGVQAAAKRVEGRNIDPLDAAHSTRRARDRGRTGLRGPLPPPACRRSALPAW